jgi:hypothetical protein
VVNEKSIEVTEGMIAAGVRALSDGKYYGLPGDLDRWQMVEDIYTAMSAAAPAATQKGGSARD